MRDNPKVITSRVNLLQWPPVMVLLRFCSLLCIVEGANEFVALVGQDSLPMVQFTRTIY